MAQDSKRKRRLRRVKREKSLAFRLVKQLYVERQALRAHILKTAAGSTTPEALPNGQETTPAV